jgi:flagellar protein FliT
MDAAEALSRYREIRKTTQRMLEAARAGEWDRLVELEAARRDLIGAVTAESVSFGPLAAEKDALIQAVLEADREITALTRAWMDEMNEVLASVHAQRRLERAYHGG